MKRRSKQTGNKRTKNMNVNGGNNQFLFGTSNAEQHIHYHTRDANAANAIREIWESIVDVEHFLTTEINERINEAVRQDCNCKYIDIDAEIIKRTFNLIRKRVILLPSAVARAAEYIIHYNCQVYNGYIATINRGCRRDITLEEVNRYVSDRLNSATYRQQKKFLMDSYGQI